MKLKEHLTVTDQTISGFARKYGRDPRTVHRHSTGERTPDREWMAFYFEATAGAVTPNDFYGLPNAARQEPVEVAA